MTTTPAASPSRVRLRPSIEPFAASDGALYLLDGGAVARFVIRDCSACERRLFEALDGDGMTPAEPDVGAALDQLAGLGLLQEVEPGLPAGGERMDRQLAWLGDRFATRGEALAAQERLGCATIAVLGCGGLGCWALAALACAGVGGFVLVDDDTVELSNLNRQILFAAADVGRPKVDAAAEAILRFAPETSVDPRRCRLRSVEDVAAAVDGCAFVVETADRPMYELPRWVDRACRRTGIPHISAAQHPPLVRIGPLRVPGRSPCLDCVEADARDRFPLFDELAAFRAARDRPTPTLGFASGLVGSLLAAEVVHFLTGAHPPATLDRSLVFDLGTFASRLEGEDVPPCGH